MTIINTWEEETFAKKKLWLCNRALQPQILGKNFAQNRHKFAEQLDSVQHPHRKQNGEGQIYQVHCGTLECEGEDLPLPNLQPEVPAAVTHHLALICDKEKDCYVYSDRSRDRKSSQRPCWLPRKMWNHAWARHRPGIGQEPSQILIWIIQQYT